MPGGLHLGLHPVSLALTAIALLTVVADFLHNRRRTHSLLRAGGAKRGSPKGARGGASRAGGAGRSAAVGVRSPARGGRVGAKALRRASCSESEDEEEEEVLMDEPVEDEDDDEDEDDEEQAPPPRAKTKAAKAAPARKSKPKAGRRK